ncbi:MAG TPA: protein phosphatase 2C domain-containing protein [Thermodesulfovibrionales bacterium]|nr:protein phosphatase 2C domain-containing protein [Thermodesulfovibrionales bacterium]
MFTVAYYMNMGLRDGQEDCIFVNGAVFQQNKFEGIAVRRIKKEKALFAVCDGMGGHSRGEWASRFVCEKLKTGLKYPGFSRDAVELLMENIQNWIENEMVDNSGTTVAGVAMKGSESIIFNAGDSRVYKITKGDIQYMSHDHSLVQRSVDLGYISQKDAFSHPHKNVIEFGIGDVFKIEWAEGAREVCIREDVLGSEEYYLICSDGVNDVLRDEEILETLSPDPLKGCDELVARAAKRMKDNLSFILIGNN